MTFDDERPFQRLTALSGVKMMHEQTEQDIKLVATCLLGVLRKYRIHRQVRGSGSVAIVG